MEPASNNLRMEQRRRLDRFHASASVDIHCHCLPEVDDGPATLAEALALCEAMAKDGITHVAATPHQLGRYDGQNSPAEIRRKVIDLNVALAREQIPLIVVPGADIRIDERLPLFLESDQALSLADGRKYVLLELPHETFVDIGWLLELLAKGGMRAILTHPERHPFLAARPQLVYPWLETGMLVQVTAGSLVGDFGSGTKQAAWDWLGRGLVHLVATDAHDVRRRPPRMALAIEAICERMPQIVARRLCIENPLTVISGGEVPGTTPHGNFANAVVKHA